MVQEITRILNRIDDGDTSASDELFEIVYDDLRRIAEQRMANESPGHTLQATALVNETYLRLLGADQQWDSKAHFFAAAAESMRRILVDRARKKHAKKRGGDWARVELHENAARVDDPSNEVEAVSDALDRFAEHYPERASLVKMRYFVGMTLPEIANALDISLSTAERHWAFAKAWLLRELRK